MNYARSKVLYSVIVGSLSNILEQAYLLVEPLVMSIQYTMILLIVTVMRYVSVRSAVLHAHLIPFVHTRRMSPEDTNIDLT